MHFGVSKMYFLGFRLQVKLPIVVSHRNNNDNNTENILLKRP